MAPKFVPDDSRTSCFGEAGVSSVQPAIAISLIDGIGISLRLPLLPAFHVVRVLAIASSCLLIRPSSHHLAGPGVLRLVVGKGRHAKRKEPGAELLGIGFVSARHDEFRQGLGSLEVAKDDTIGVVHMQRSCPRASRHRPAPPFSPIAPAASGPSSRRAHSPDHRDLSRRRQCHTAPCSRPCGAAHHHSGIVAPLLPVGLRPPPPATATDARAPARSYRASIEHPRPRPESRR
jgi:hypothetical protein